MQLSEEDRKIKKMIKKVNDRKVEFAELRGEKSQIMKSLSDEGCETLDELDIEITEETSRVKKLEKIIITEFESIENDYDWS